MNQPPQFYFWTKAERRYVCLLQQNLFGQWVLTQRWWGIHTGKGGSLSQTFESYEAAVVEIAQVEKRRRWRHYHRVE